MKVRIRQRSDGFLYLWGVFAVTWGDNREMWFGPFSTVAEALRAERDTRELMAGLQRSEPMPMPEAFRS